MVGVPPNIMGIGPAEAIPAALKKAGMWVHTKCQGRVGRPGVQASRAFYGNTVMRFYNRNFAFQHI